MHNSRGVDCAPRAEKRKPDCRTAQPTKRSHQAERRDGSAILCHGMLHVTTAYHEVSLGCDGQPKYARLACEHPRASWPTTGALAWGAFTPLDARQPRRRLCADCSEHKAFASGRKKRNADGRTSKSAQHGELVTSSATGSKSRWRASGYSSLKSKFKLSSWTEFDKPSARSERS